MRIERYFEPITGLPSRRDEDSCVLQIATQIVDF